MNNYSRILIFLISSAFGCAGELGRTQVMVVVDAEHQMRTEAASLVITIKGSTGRAGSARHERYSNEFKDISWPREVAVGPLDDDVTRIFEVIAVVKDIDGADIGQVRAIVGFADQRTVELYLVFEDSCRYEICGDDTTCSDGHCTDAQIGADELPEYGAVEHELDELRAEPDAGAGEPLEDAAAAGPEGYDASRARDAGTLPDGSGPPPADAAELDPADAGQDGGGPEPLYLWDCECIAFCLGISQEFEYLQVICGGWEIIEESELFAEDECLEDPVWNGTCSRCSCTCSNTGEICE